jgi:hypothetical protein
VILKDLRLPIRESMAVTTGSIADRPVPLHGTQERRQRESIHEYMGIADDNHPKLSKTLVWQPQEKPTKKSKNWYNKYSVTNNPDERLLKNFRGKGY